MNKILKLKCSSFISRINLNKQIICYLNTKTIKQNETGSDFNLESLGIKSNLKKFIKYESFVYRSFFGEFDSDYLNFPKLVESISEEKILINQYKCVQNNFENILKNPKDFGFLNLSSFTETEKVRLFEAIGYSLKLNSSSITKSTDLITLNELLVTDFFLANYEEKKNYIKSLLPLIIHNSLVMNTIELSNNDQIKDLIWPGIENFRIGFAFDEPNDEFLDPPYPYWDSIAKYDQETQIWTLNGKKSRILKNDYDYFLIFCKIKNEEKYGIASFLVDKNQVKVENDGTDNYGTSYLKISFDQLNLPKNSTELLVDNKAGLMLNIKSSGHLLVSGTLLGIMKQFFQSLFSIIDSNVPYKNLFENYLTKMTEMIYIIESMLYLTASHYDTFDLEHIDLYLQAIILKILSAEYSEEMLNMIRFLFKTKQSSSIISNDINNVLNVLSTFLDSNISNRLLLASFGLQNIGTWNYDNIVKLKLKIIYPFHFYKYNTFLGDKMERRFKNSWADYRALKKLHPSLKESAELLKKVLEIEFKLGSHILQTYGKECVKYQIDLNRFSTIIMAAFQMVSVLCRTNNSLNQNQSFSNQELLLCKNICNNAYRTTMEMKNLIYGVLDTSEEKRSKMIHSLNMRFDGYFVKPTFDRNV